MTHFSKMPLNTLARSLYGAKYEMFDSSAFHDFYTKKSLWEGDLGIKIKHFCLPCNTFSLPLRI